MLSAGVSKMFHFWVIRGAATYSYFVPAFSERGQQIA